MGFLTFVLMCLVIASIGSYVMAFGAATKFWGQKLAGVATDEEIYQNKIASGATDAEARGYLAGKSLFDNVGYQQALTPGKVNMLMVLFVFGNIAALILGVLSFRWYAGLAAIPGIWIATSILRNLFPGPANPFYREQIIASLLAKHVQFAKAGDMVRAYSAELLVSMFDNFEVDGKLKGPQPWQV